MKISDIEVIEFRTWKTGHGTRWGYGVEGKRRPSRNAITKISTDDGAAGYALGGNRDVMEQLIKPLLLGEDPLDREKLWNWLDQLTSRGPKLAERDMGLVDCALWDLAGRVTGLPINKLLGGARDKVKAYASTAPNLGPPEVYVEHALACKQRGYKAYKIHAYICWNPHTAQPAPQLPRLSAGGPRSLSGRPRGGRRRYGPDARSLRGVHVGRGAVGGARAGEAELLLAGAPDDRDADGAVSPPRTGAIHRDLLA